jgi:predicted RNA binding protein YcfA (HicA-like mRNA interferase family)
MHTCREPLRLLNEHGLEVVSVRGSHYKMRHGDGRWLTFPFCERQYPKGAYFNILKLAGLRPVDIKRRHELAEAAGTDRPMLPHQVNAYRRKHEPKPRHVDDSV